MTAIYKYRKDQNMTQRELAKAVGITASALHNTKLEQENPTS